MRIQTDAYVTAYCELEDDVFIAPCVVTTNDNFMGRTERRKELMKGATIRRGARVGGAAILLPGVEIGEEAFVGAGAIVLRDVPARTVVVGQPGARRARRRARRAARRLTPSTRLRRRKPSRSSAGGKRPSRGATTLARGSSHPCRSCCGRAGG